MTTGSLGHAAAGPRRSLLVTVLLAPALASDLAMSDWDLLIRQGRRANLLAELAWRLVDHGLFDTVPQAPRHHLVSAQRMVAQQEVALRHELLRVSAALAAIDARVAFLKGAGYVAAGLPWARGRAFADVDVLVPRSRLDAAETALRQHGWLGSHHDAYDQRYYREWMHELPPMTHVRRGTTIDVHHSILPETARLKVDIAAMLDGAIAATPEVQVLAPVDMLLHSATHLFHEGEFDNALRDLFDLDAMLRYFPLTAPAQDFWSGLVPRAQALGLARPLYYALRYCGRMLATPIPPQVLAAAEIGRPSPAVGALMDACWQRVLQPQHASADSTAAAAARLALYLRSHWIRMPWPLLGYHLGRKAVMRMFEKAPQAPPAPGAKP